MNRWWSRAERPILLAPLACFGLAFALNATPWFQEIALQTLDVRTRLRQMIGQEAPSDELRIVGIGDRSTVNIEPWPFRRAWHAHLQQLLGFTPPAVLCWDVIFADRVDIDGNKWDPDADEDFATTTAALAEQGTPVVFAGVSGIDPTGESVRELGLTRPLPWVRGDVGRLLGDPELTMPFPELRENSTFGLVDAQPGEGGVVRWIPMVLRVREQVLPSLSLQALMQYWRVSPDQVEVELGRAIRLPRPDGHTVAIPIDEAGRYLINYRYGKMETEADFVRAFTTIEYFDLLLALNQTFVVKDAKAPPPPQVGGKLVLVGEFSTDVGTSPLEALSPLVLIHANILDNILKEDFATRANPLLVWGGALLVSYLGLIGLGRRSPLVLGAFSMCTVGGFALFCVWAWVQWSLWVPMFAPALGFSGLQYIVITRRVKLEQRARENMKQMFGSYLSPGLLEQMVAKDELAVIGGERRVVTILFSDLRDFTSWSENTPEDVLLRQLNEYLAAMVDCIHAERGTLHKFIGDAVMAVWGDIGSAGEEEDARRAARAALAMIQKLDTLNERWARAGAHTLRMGIGLNTGRVVVGNVGSPQRMEFTVIGDAVNLAARLESMTKTLKTDILIGESVARLLGDGFRVVPRGEVPIKGKAAPVPVFALEGRATGGGRTEPFGAAREGE